MAITLHVFRSGKGWCVKREDEPGVYFETEAKAIAAARAMAKKTSPVQIVVHKKSGVAVNILRRGLPKRQPVRLGKGTVPLRDIQKAVAKVILERVIAS
jgi:hypothetical protein